MIRKVERTDMPQLKKVIDSAELFPSEMLDDMIAEYFDDPNSTSIWLTKNDGNTPIIVTYCIPEQMTEGTYNMLAIAVHKSQQGKGVGREMMAYLENLLQQKGVRVLIVETSGLPEFERTREFYDKCGYTREAVIRDFYAEGEDKVIFWKKLR